MLSAALSEGDAELERLVAETLPGEWRALVTAMNRLYIAPAKLHEETAGR
ncbi:hypothetical protein [Gordonia oryzae]|nr:hypothetical protein [Gordonia oryzae]